MRKQIVGLAAGMVLLAAAGAAAGESKIDITGYVQPAYTASSNGTADSFSLRLARLVFSGHPNPDWSYQFQVDALGTPSLLDAYLDFSREKLLPEPYTFKARIGQFRVPFSMESLAPDPGLDTVNRSQVVNALAPGRDVGTKGRDIGAYVQLSASPWNIKRLAEVTVGQFNGEGANALDKNHRKGLALRGVINPSPALSFGASVYEGTRFSTGAVSNRTGFEAAFNCGRASLKGEYVHGREASVYKEGWYAQAGFFALPKVLQLVGKYDAYDPNLKTQNDKTAVATAGVNWFFTDGMRLQANYEWKYRQDGVLACNTFSSVLALTF